MLLVPCLDTLYQADTPIRQLLSVWAANSSCCPPPLRIVLRKAPRQTYSQCLVPGFKNSALWTPMGPELGGTILWCGSCSRAPSRGQSSGTARLSFFPYLILFPQFFIGFFECSPEYITCANISCSTSRKPNPRKHFSCLCLHAYHKI